MDFRVEFEAYEREHPYREFPVQGGRFRYILSGESGKPAIAFLNGLGMQEAWLRYHDHTSLSIFAIPVFAAIIRRLPACIPRDHLK